MDRKPNHSNDGSLQSIDEKGRYTSEDSASEIADAFGVGKGGEDLVDAFYRGDRRFDALRDSPWLKYPDFPLSDYDLELYLVARAGYPLSLDDIWKSKAYRFMRKKQMQISESTHYAEEQVQMMANKAAIAFYNQKVKPFENTAAAIPGHAKFATIIGSPSSGKSSRIGKIAEEMGLKENQYVVLDADDIKPFCDPKVYDGGIGSAAVHRISSAAKRILTQVLTNANFNIIMPIVGQKPEYLEFSESIGKNEGYSENMLAFVKTGKEKCYARNFKRAFETGRCVPMHIIDEASKGCPKTFEEVKDRGDNTGYTRLLEIDNN